MCTWKAPVVAQIRTEMVNNATGLTWSFLYLTTYQNWPLYDKRMQALNFGYYWFEVLIFYLSQSFSFSLLLSLWLRPFVLEGLWLLLFIYPAPLGCMRSLPRFSRFLRLSSLLCQYVYCVWRTKAARSLGCFVCMFVKKAFIP